MPEARPQQILSFDFHTLMLFKCLEREYAEAFCKGQLHFGMPISWIEEELKGNKGQGDALEGSFISVLDTDNSPFVIGLKRNPEYNFLDHNGFTFFRRKRIESIPCMCLYSLNDTAFQKSNDASGRVHYVTNVSRAYFQSFSKCRSRDEFEHMPRSKQPVVVFVNSPHAFFQRIREFFTRFGIAEEDIIISPVQYLQKHCISLSFLPYPMELLLKDSYFQSQHEIRVIINSDNPSIWEYLQRNNFNIDIGPLEDITEIYDTYFNDLTIERSDKHHILFTLPHPIETRFKDMDEIELYKQLLDSVYGRRKISSPSEIEKAKEVFSRLLMEKYGILAQCLDNDITIYGATDRLLEYIRTSSEPHMKKTIFQKEVEDIRNSGDYDRAISLCKSQIDASDNAEYAFLELGRTYEIMQDFTQAIETYGYCITNDYCKREALAFRSELYCYIGEHEKAIIDLHSFQDIVGYDPKIYNNIGINLIHLARYKEAINYFDKALQIDSHDSYALYNRGVAYFKAGNKAAAKIDIESAMRLTPHNEFYQEQYKIYFD